METYPIYHTFYYILLFNWSMFAHLCLHALCTVIQIFLVSLIIVGHSFWSRIFFCRQYAFIVLVNASFICFISWNCENQASVRFSGIERCMSRLSMMVGYFTANFDRYFVYVLLFSRLSSLGVILVGLWVLLISW